MLIQLLQYATAQENASVAGPIMEFAGGVAFNLRDTLNWAPTQLLFNAVADGRTSAARWQALLRLVSESTDAQIRARLLALVRNPTGPPTWPDLSADLVEYLEFMPQDGARLLDNEVRSAPGALRNALAKWRLTCGRGHAVPRPPTDPCHPRNALRRAGGPGST